MKATPRTVKLDCGYQYRIKNGVLQFNAGHGWNPSVMLTVADIGRLANLKKNPTEEKQP